MNNKSNLEIKQEKKKGIIILELKGVLDARTHRQFKQLLETTLDKNLLLLCDLTNVDYISSAGVGVLVEYKNLCTKMNGDLFLCGLKSDIEKIFLLLGFSHLFVLFKNQEEAIENII